MCPPPPVPHNARHHSTTSHRPPRWGCRPTQHAGRSGPPTLGDSPIRRLAREADRMKGCLLPTPMTPASARSSTRSQPANTAPGAAIRAQRAARRTLEPDAQLKTATLTAQRREPTTDPRATTGAATGPARAATRCGGARRARPGRPTRSRLVLVCQSTARRRYAGQRPYGQHHGAAGNPVGGVGDDRFGGVERQHCIGHREPAARLRCSTIGGPGTDRCTGHCAGPVWRHRHSADPRLGAADAVPRQASPHRQRRTCPASHDA